MKFINSILVLCVLIKEQIILFPLLLVMSFAEADW